MLEVGIVPDSVPEPAVGSGSTVVVEEAHGQPLILPEIGERFGRYRVLRRLGRGGMGVVYEAEETDSGRRVALKVINQKLSSPHDRARFLREGRLAASINHPNCVYVYGTEEIEGTPVIAMEFVTGGTLQQQLNAHGPLAVGRAVDAILQVVEGLEAAHDMGILHRDIKPSNCFEDEQGTVKIGDFGLSISTLPRPETNITESGAMVGTPAFCSPEQLRGEELNARSDMYAVGVTLFQLLTGKLPFEAETIAQLVANTLEKRAKSPAQLRKEVPAGLARVILRCLEKQPSERYRTYADLRRALQPYSSTAPTPATLGLRFLAGVVDLMAISIVGQAVILMTVGDPFAILDWLAKDDIRGWLIFMPCFALVVLYYALSEWRWGATAGKALCRLRVLRADRNYPSLAQALLRALLFVAVPMAPFWVFVIVTGDPLAMAEQSPRVYALSFSYHVLLALLFVTARRRNAFAAIHDLASRTRVVSRAAWELRPALDTIEPQPAGVESKPMVGPYHVIEPLGGGGDAEWAEGYDLRLLRRVLLRMVPVGTPPLPPRLRQITRPGRLRWLTGRRDALENWDAFEGSGGQALLKLAEHPQPWSRVRFWLHDLAVELSAAEKDGTPPLVLALDRVWITRDGRAKLFDCDAPGIGAGTVSSRVVSSGTQSAQAADARNFVQHVAAVALAGRAKEGAEVRAVPGILPLHARQFLDVLPTATGADAIAAALKPLLRRTADVNRMRRAAVVLGCVALPLFMTLAAVLGMSLMQRWQRQNPGLIELSNVLNTWKAKKMPFIPKDQLPSDRLIGVYIAAHYRAVITNQTIWSSAIARALIPRDAREFAEQSLDRNASCAPDELAEAGKQLGPVANQFGEPSMPTPRFIGPFLLWFGLLAYAAIPAFIAALLFRGGLVLRIAGVTFVRRDGRRAGRMRLLWRGVVAWCPVAGALALGLEAMESKSVMTSLLTGLLLVVLATWSLWLPNRGLQDKLAGTWPVPR